MFDDLKKSGEKGTPLTDQILQAWLDKKRKRRAAKAEKPVEAELKRRRATRVGLAVLSGQDLYEYNRDMFRDNDEDDAAAVEAGADGGSGGGSSGGFVDDGNRPKGGDAEEKKGPDENGGDDAVRKVADQVNSELFLEGDDDNLDDIDEDDE